MVSQGTSRFFELVDGFYPSDYSRRCEHPNADPMGQNKGSMSGKAPRYTDF